MASPKFAQPPIPTKRSKPEMMRKWIDRILIVIGCILVLFGGWFVGSLGPAGR